jgi:hypothetical protein
MLEREDTLAWQSITLEGYIVLLPYVRRRVANASSLHPLLSLALHTQARTLSLVAALEVRALRE